MPSHVDQEYPVWTVLKLAAFWIALLVPPFIERTLLGARTYYFLYIGLASVFCDLWRNHQDVFLDSAACKTRAEFRLDCVPVLVSFYLQRSGGVRL